MKLYDLMGSTLSTDGTNSLLMNNPDWTWTFELELGTDNSTTFAMVTYVPVVERIGEHPKR